MTPDISIQVANKIGELLDLAQIARELKLSTSEVIQYAFVAIGNGLIRESDLFFVLKRKYEKEESELEPVENFPAKKVHTWLRVVFLNQQIDPDSYDLDELELYISYRKRRVYIFDMYVFLTELERTLHQQVKKALTKEFGIEESGWWKKGVPDIVRVDCARMREFDQESVDHPYHFTTFIHLSKIIKSNWGLFSKRLPQAVNEVKKAQEQFLNELARLNTLRNQVMHPVRNALPTESDFEFTQEMHQKLNVSKWRK